MLHTPALLLSFLLASAIAAVFFLWQGRALRDLFIFWLVAIAGFAAGQLIGELLKLIPFTIGQVRVVEATLTCLLFLLIVNWLRQGRAS